VAAASGLHLMLGNTQENQYNKTEFIPSEVSSLKSKEKQKPPVAPFAIGDLVAYNGRKPRYLGKVGLVYKVERDACNVQFFDDPLMPNGGAKTFKFAFKDIRQHRPSNSSIPEPQLPPPNPPLP
jgi:hypothetical protein